MQIEITGVGVFREIMQCFKVPFTIEAGENKELALEFVLQQVDAAYGGKFRQELTLADGSPNLWTRVLLNGWDTRFLPKEKQVVKEGDSLLFSSVMAGG